MCRALKARVSESSLRVSSDGRAIASAATAAGGRPGSSACKAATKQPEMLQHFSKGEPPQVSYDSSHYRSAM